MVEVVRGDVRVKGLWYLVPPPPCMSTMLQIGFDLCINPDHVKSRAR